MQTLLSGLVKDFSAKQTVYRFEVFVTSLFIITTSKSVREEMLIAILFLSLFSM